LIAARVQRALLIIGFPVAAFLLLRFAIDFFIEMPVILAVPFAVLALASLAIAATNIFRVKDDKAHGSNQKIGRALLLLAIPLGFLASSLDCSGLSAQGCTQFCSAIKLVWIPLLAVIGLAYYFMEKAWLLILVSAMSFVPLVPHCICYNVGNGWWIERLGASPTCYAWGFVVTLIAVSAIKYKARLFPSLMLCGVILSGAFGFFISHHYFHFPW